MKRHSLVVDVIAAAWVVAVEFATVYHVHEERRRVKKNIVVAAAAAVHEAVGRNVLMDAHIHSLKLIEQYLHHNEAVMHVMVDTAMICFPLREQRANAPWMGTRLVSNYLPLQQVWHREEEQQSPHLRPLECSLRFQEPLIGHSIAKHLPGKTLDSRTGDGLHHWQTAVQQ